MLLFVDRNWLDSRNIGLTDDQKRILRNMLNALNRPAGNLLQPPRLIGNVLEFEFVPPAPLPDYPEAHGNAPDSCYSGLLARCGVSRDGEITQIAVRGANQSLLDIEKPAAPYRTGAPRPSQRLRSHRTLRELSVPKLLVQQRNLGCLRVQGWKPRQVEALIANDHGKRSVPHIVEHSDRLLAIPISIEETIGICIKQSGGKVLVNALDNFEALLSLGYAREEIIHIATYCNGATSIFDTIREMHRSLLNLALDRSDVIAIASHQGGTETLKVLPDMMEDLMRAGFTNREVIEVASHNYAKPTLEAMLHTPWPGLLTKSQLLAMAAYSNGSRCIAWTMEYADYLLKAGKSIDDIIRLAKNPRKEVRDAAIREHAGT